MNIVDPILFQCKWQPSELAICAHGTIFNSLTYGQLEWIIHNVGRKALERGLIRGNVVALFIRDPILHVAFIFGLAKQGIVTVSAREMELPSELQVDARFVDDSYPHDPSGRAVVVDKQWVLGTGIAPDVSDRDKESIEDFCRIVLTSGSTGEPKAIARSTKHVLAHMYSLLTVYGSRFATSSRIHVDMGMSTGIGFTCMLYTLSRGGTLFLRGRTAADSLQAILSNRVESLLIAPNSLAEFADIFENNPRLTSSLDTILTGGSFISRSLSERVRMRLCTNIVNVYGSTETGPVATASLNAIANIEGAVGYLTPGVEVNVVNDSGEILPAGKEGRLRVRGSGVVNGYIGDPEGTKKMFLSEGFCPGDIGTVLPNGVLKITGRELIIINLGGDKVSPERVETALTSFSAVRDAAAFQIATSIGTQQLCSAIVWHEKPDPVGLRAHLLKRLPPGFVPKSYVAVDSIPRNASGKIDRLKLKTIAAERVIESAS